MIMSMSMDSREFVTVAMQDLSDCLQAKIRSRESTQRASSTIRTKLDVLS